MRTPRNGLYGSAMLIELDKGLRGALGTPKYQLVVIAA